MVTKLLDFFLNQEGYKVFKDKIITLYKKLAAQLGCLVFTQHISEVYPLFIFIFSNTAMKMYSHWLES